MILQIQCSFYYLLPARASLIFTQSILILDLQQHKTVILSQENLDLCPVVDIPASGLISDKKNAEEVENLQGLV